MGRCKPSVFHLNSHYSLEICCYRVGHILCRPALFMMGSRFEADSVTVVNQIFGIFDRDVRRQVTQTYTNVFPLANVAD